MANKIINAEKAPKAIGPYSQGVMTDSLLYISGQLGIDPQSGELLEGVQAQTEQALKNMKAILEAAGLNLSHIVKTTIYLMDMGDFAKVNETYAAFFQANFPARATIQVAGLPKGGRVEIEAIAAL
jgi:2-iminobutanoate/2-iminopropanoate deaminase